MKRRPARSLGSVRQSVPPNESSSKDANHDVQRIVVFGSATLIAWCIIFPTDAVSVRLGDALPLTILALAGLFLAGLVAMRRGIDLSIDRVDACLIALPTWITLAGWGTSHLGNSIDASHVTWMWWTADIAVILFRRLPWSSDLRKLIMMILVGFAVQQALIITHQTMVELPDLRLKYLEDPDGLVAEAGIDAPAGSAMRLKFASRLFDGGPSGSFALAKSVAGILSAGAACLLIPIPNQSLKQRMVWIPIALGLQVFLLIPLGWTESRSALASWFLLFAAVTLWPWIMVMFKKPNSRVRACVIAVLLLIGFSQAGGLHRLGNDDLGPLGSLSTRFSYWKSTINMVIDHPVFGIGPGHYQSLFGTYRAPECFERIADPHNFLFETLADGGPIAIALLSLLSWFVFKSARQGVNEITASAKGAYSFLAKTFLISSLVFVTVRFALFGFAPDLRWFAASSVAVAVTASLWILSAKTGWPNAKGIYWASAAMLIHLGFSGGWMYPGTAVWLWLGIAALSPSTPEQVDATSKSWSQFTSLVAAAGFILCLTQALLPKLERDAIGSEVAFALSANRVADADRLIDDAIRVDPDATELARFSLELQIQALLNAPEDFGKINLPEKARQDVESKFARVVEAAKNDLSIQRFLVEQRLHLYQRFGNEIDLAKAEKRLRTMDQQWPYDPWVISQIAEIAATRKNDEFDELIARAISVSQLGKNLERAIWNQLIYVAEPVGVAVRTGPKRVSAEKRLLTQEQHEASAAFLTQ
ncbi:MAG: O-antigen ligase family protein [Planctomycetota bacterium]